MALAPINPAEIGTYQPGAICPYASRKQAAQLGAFGVYDMGGGAYWVWRTGGGWHYVHVCLWQGRPIADCDCHDWTAYGAGFHRACVHIWRVMLTQAVGVC